jgi:uncharacterized protein with HEPN domain
MWRDDAYLLDILIAARRVIEFRKDLTWDQFQQSSLHQHAIAKALENIGEAAGKVSDETRSKLSSVPWKQMIALRHRITHDYFRLDLLKIWEIASHDVPSLINAIEPHIPPESP